MCCSIWISRSLWDSGCVSNIFWWFRTWWWWGIFLNLFNNTSCNVHCMITYISCRCCACKSIIEVSSKIYWFSFYTQLHDNHSIRTIRILCIIKFWSNIRITSKCRLNIIHAHICLTKGCLQSRLEGIHL